MENTLIKIVITSPNINNIKVEGGVSLTLEEITLDKLRFENRRNGKC